MAFSPPATPASKASGAAADTPLDRCLCDTRGRTFGKRGPEFVTYAVVDAQTGSMISSHGSFDAARAERAKTASDHPENVSIYVFDDTGLVAGESADSQEWPPASPHF